ncbi:hypothetical protein V144x_40790 [Gimesia aquarii]|uniref:Uncharacterized protein n=1 Tax=Gimesia aquarii TaxID=2527964 RepID=A0A517VZZ0_9PLAN|nr:hypothetical protein V144x_40790 [Gimesia aquarii]
MSLKKKGKLALAIIIRIYSMYSISFLIANSDLGFAHSSFNLNATQQSIMRQFAPLGQAVAIMRRCVLLLY